MLIAIIEKDIMKRLAEATIGLVALALGGLIYVRYRSESLLMFDWFQNLGLGDLVKSIRMNATNSELFEWVKFNMPAGLWLLAYMFMIDSVWGKEKNYVYLYFLYILPFLAITSELMQISGLLPGTFDVMDLFCYVFAILLFVIIKKL